MTAAITLWQPWALACVTGLKRWETRPRSMGHRGLTCIHAALKPIDLNQMSAELVELLLDRWGNNWVNERAALGAVIGQVRITDCVQMTEEFIAAQSRQEILLGDWRPGRWAYKLEEPVWYLWPYKARGYQSMPWEWRP